MAATMKHRRSKSKRKSTRGADRYDKILRKYKKMKKLGGSFFVKGKNDSEARLSHRVDKDNVEYKNVKVVRE